MDVSLIVAMTRQRLIGREGSLPWHYSEDLKHFKRQTLDQTILMGRKSYESLGQPLPRRTHLVVSRRLANEAGPEGAEWDGARYFASLTDACAWVDRNRPGDSDHAWVIGGGEIFGAFLAPLDAGASPGPLPAPRRLVVTWVPAMPLEPDDVLFPHDEAWLERHFAVTERHPGQTPGLEFVTYERPGPAER